MNNLFDFLGLDFRFDIIIEYLPFLLKGTLLTLGLSAASILIGSTFGFVLSLGKLSDHKIFRLPATWYIHIVRGTPVLVQIYIVHYGVVLAILGTTNAIVAAITALSLNSAAYTAEIFRAGIQSIDKGQAEASRSLGLTKHQTMRHIIFPQALKRMIPPFGNEFIMLIKDSALVTVIAAPELMYWANAMRGQYMRVWEPYLAAAVVYLIITFSLSMLLERVERRMHTR